MTMLKKTNIDFKLKTVDNLKCSGNVKDIQMSLIKNTFCVNVIYNEGETITTEYTKPKEQDTIEEVNMNLFDKETEDNQQEQLNISCKVEEPEPEPEEVKVEEPEPEPEEVKEEEEEEVKEEEPEQQEQPKDKSLSIEELKELLTEKLEKKIPLLVITELLNKRVIILKYMKFMDYYNITKKKLFIL